jgi:hypothetical protein
MTNHFFTLATAAAATVQVGIAIVFFGTLTVIVLSSFLNIQAP